MSILTELADDGDWISELRYSHGLIGSFATGKRPETCTMNGFARSRKNPSAHDEIQIDTAHDDDRLQSLNPFHT